MSESKIIIANIENTPSKHESYQNYEYYKHLIVSKKPENQCTVAIMEIPPQKHTNGSGSYLKKFEPGANGPNFF